MAEHVLPLGKDHCQAPSPPCTREREGDLRPLSREGLQDLRWALSLVKALSRSLGLSPLLSLLLSLLLLSLLSVSRPCMSCIRGR